MQLKLKNAMAVYTAQFVCFSGNMENSQQNTFDCF